MDTIICKMTSDFIGECLDLMSKNFDSIVKNPNLMNSILNDEKYIPLAALKNGEFIGGMIVEKVIDPLRLPNEIYFIRYLMVKKEYHGQGIGRKLLNYIENLAKENNIQRIELTCANFRTDSHKFYEATGFTVKKTKVFIKELPII